MPTDLCTKCNRKVLTRDRGLCCALCDCWFHAKCVNVPDEKYKQLKQIEDIIYWFCENDKLKLEGWKNHEIQETQIVEKIVNIENEVRDLKKKLECKSSVPSYANVLKNAVPTTIPNKPVDGGGILVYPKDKSKSSSSTEKKIKESIKLSDLKLGVTSLKPIQGGGVYLGTASKDETEKLKEELSKKLGPTFETRKPKTIAPKLIISGITREYDNNTLLEELFATNPRLSDEDLNNIKVSYHFKKQGQKGKTIWSYVVETNGCVFSKLVNNYIMLDYNYHYVKEYFNVLRCFRCQGYNHRSSECSHNSTICAHCCLEHDSRSCKEESKSCYNCNESNKKGSNFNVNHSCGSSSCNVQISMLKKLQSKINYNLTSLCQ